MGAHRNKVFDTVDFRVARTRNEIENAYALVYKEYLRKGYTVENTSGLRLSIYNTLPQTTTLIAILNHKSIIATASIVPDSPLGLPMDKIYRKEINMLRRKGIKLCEITMLVSKADFYKDPKVRLSFSKFYFMPYFFKVFLDYVRDVCHYDCMCIAINPQDKIAFRRILFREMGRLRLYPDVNYAPAIAEYLDVHIVNEAFTKLGNKRLYDIFVKHNTQPEKFSGKFRFSPKDLRYFFVEKGDVFKTAAKPQMEYIKDCYPSYDWRKIVKK